MGASKISVEGTDIREVRNALGLYESGADIKITMNTTTSDYHRYAKAGCIVDARRYGEKVPREFHTAAAAVQYIASLLKGHDKLAAKNIAEEKAKLRSRAAKENIRKQIHRLQKMLEE